MSGDRSIDSSLDHPDLELVGFYVYSDGKVGRDAGEIAWREPVRVVATDQLEEILALDADMVVHAARPVLGCPALAVELRGPRPRHGATHP